MGDMYCFVKVGSVQSSVFILWQGGPQSDKAGIKFK
jgi:hypothetical protein